MIRKINSKNSINIKAILIPCKTSAVDYLQPEIAKAGSLKKITLSDNVKYSVWLSFYELYNDSVYDLLTIPATRKTIVANERPSLKIREDANRVPYVEGLFYTNKF